MINLPPAELVAYIAGLMFDRRLTDIAGGNVSARQGETVYLTPRYAGQRWHWKLAPEDIVTGPLEGDELVNNPSFSREGLSHLAIYRAFPDVMGVIHAHAPNVLPFCATVRPIEPILEGVKKYGVLPYHDPAPAYSQQQADSIVANLRGKEALMKSAAGAVLMPRHGIIIAGKDLFAAIDALERIDVNARCILAAQILAA